MSDPQAFQLILETESEGQQEFTLEGERYVLGRDPSPEVDITLASPMISRRHAQLERQGDGWSILDLGSSNGTKVNGVAVGRDPVRLRAGDRINLGSSVVLRLTGPAIEPPAATKLESPSPAATVMAESMDLPEPEGPPHLIVQISGQNPEDHTLEGEELTLGRAQENDIVIPSMLVSRQHAQLKQVNGGYQIIMNPEAKNPLHVDGRPVTGPYLLKHDDMLRIGSHEPGMMVSMVYKALADAGEDTGFRSIQFGEGNVLEIGRDPSNDVVLDAPTISRFHARIERVGKRFRVVDLDSSNGTFLNNQRVEEEWASVTDTVRIGPYRLVLGEDALAQHSDTGGMRVDAYRLNKWVRKDLNILKDVSVSIEPRELIVIVGQSGGGKSTLLDGLAGLRPATHGTVMVNDLNAYRNFDAVRDHIGYVPQKDIIHMELTVHQALQYAARLRMPADTTREEREARIDQVLEDLDLAHRKDVQISGLSGGQQKRVSIGVELLTEPGLFFLDEPTSGLDPGTETAFMHLMRRLADQGRTIVLVTHATKNVMLADKVLFLARGGHLAWYGPPNEALDYFAEYQPERDRRVSGMEFDQIYAILDDPSLGTAEEWDERYRTSEAYQRYVYQPLTRRSQEIQSGQSLQKDPVHTSSMQIGQQVKRKASALRQFFILSSRNLKILSRDRTSMILMLAAAPLVSMLDVLIAVMTGNDPFAYQDGSLEDAMMSFFLLIIFAAFVGGLAQMREIVKENQIYIRERLVNLKVLPYVFSKVWIAVLLALYHAAAYTAIHHLAYKMPGGIMEIGLFYITMSFLVMAGMMLGLFTSALAPNSNSAPMIVILLIMPQIVLSGALAPLPGPVSAPAATRWAFQGFMATSGAGSDVAGDVCWQLPEELREAMTLSEATERCDCMGLNALDPATCSFPGLGRFYTVEVDLPEPEQPPPLGDPPPEPEIPPPPERPEDESDSVAMADYFESLQVYQEETEQIQSDYRAEVEAYEARAQVYQAEIEKYRQERLDWQLRRSSAVESAEGLIDVYYADFGWTFVDKSDTTHFLTEMVKTWMAQGVIISVLILGVIIMVKRKDVI